MRYCIKTDISTYITFGLDTLLRVKGAVTDF